MSSAIACIARADRRDLLGDVDADRAPRDAAPAADAARAAELVEPRGQLVGHPLPVARPGRGPDAAAVQAGVIDGEAGVPALPALDVLAAEIGHGLDVRAEARRAGHRAVASAQAALGHV